MTELTLRHTRASGLLLPARLDTALGMIGKLSASGPRGIMRGQELRIALALPLDDAACAGFVLTFEAQGARVVGSARGPSGSVFAWAFHGVARMLKCELVEDDAVIAPAPEEHRAAALGYLEAYEADVRESRTLRRELDGDGFVAWLALEGSLALVDGTAKGAFADLPLDDAPALYEHLLDSDRVDDVFVSERELTRLLDRFRARAR